MSITLSLYGFLIMLGACAAYMATAFILREHRKNKLSFSISLESVLLSLVISGALGGRALFVLYHLPYFIEYPLEIPAIWHGGWVWHGALFGGGAALYIHARMNRISFLRLADVIAPGLALGQAIGRWGNYFNQEAYGFATTLPWGIYIEPDNRLAGHEQFEYFHPAFLYESLWDIALFTLLFTLAFRTRRVLIAPGIIFSLYLILYSVGRFGIELLRIDVVPVFAGLRSPQWISLILIAAGIRLLQKQRKVV
ncbi:prolipoprotein diacylglyceryl transferase [Candidatus Uhrbacteria bacterium]|nr:prolipoprotein diacylglyceryl transferase [Candidatus Uhrbacteria bacterium]